jgi:multiple sugar transport system permease protein
VSTLTRATPAATRTEPLPEQQLRPRSYWPFVLPALIVVLAVIVFPWVFTIWMSLNEWKVGSPTTFVGLANYLRLPADPRFIEAIGHTFYYTALSVALPMILGTLAAVIFHPAAALGVSSRNRDPVAGAGRDLALDAAGDADRARRHRCYTDRAL